MAKVETHKLLELIIDNIDCNIYVDSIAQVGTTAYYLINTHNTKWIGINKYYDIGGYQYKVTDIIPNASFTVIVEGTNPAPIAETIEIPAPYFQHGTFNMTANERVKLTNTDRNNDLIYFNEPSTDVYNDDELGAVDRESNCQLFFLKEADFNKWSNEQHYNYAVAATGNLVDSFITAAKHTSFVGEINKTHTGENHVKWGTISTQGHIKTIFNEQHSGKMVNITIPFLKQSCDFDPYNQPTSGSGTINIYFDGVLVSSTDSNDLDAETVNLIWQ